MAWIDGYVMPYENLQKISLKLISDYSIAMIFAQVDYYFVIIKQKWKEEEKVNLLRHIFREIKK